MIISNIVLGSSSCGHFDITATVNGVSRTVTFYRDELTLEPDEIRDAFIARLRSFAKENNYTTITQVRTNLVGKTFQL